MSNGKAAEAVGVSASSLRRWARMGILKPAFKTPGGHYQWDVPDLREQLRRMQDGDVQGKSD